MQAWHAAQELPIVQRGLKLPEQRALPPLPQTLGLVADLVDQIFVRAGRRSVPADLFQSRRAANRGDEVFERLHKLLCFCRMNGKGTVSTICSSSGYALNMFKTIDSGSSV